MGAAGCPCTNEFRVRVSRQERRSLGSIRNAGIIHIQLACDSKSIGEVSEKKLCGFPRNPSPPVLPLGGGTSANARCHEHSSDDEFHDPCHLPRNTQMRWRQRRRLPRTKRKLNAENTRFPLQVRGNCPILAIYGLKITFSTFCRCSVAADGNAFRPKYRQFHSEKRRFMPVLSQLLRFLGQNSRVAHLLRTVFERHPCLGH